MLNPEARALGGKGKALQYTTCNLHSETAPPETLLCLRTLLVCNLLPWEILRRLNESSCPSPPSATRPRRGRTNDLARAATLDAQFQPHLGLTPRTLRPYSLSPARPHMQGGRSQHSCTHRDLNELIRLQPRVWHRTPGPIAAHPTYRWQGLYYTTGFSSPGSSEVFILRVAFFFLFRFLNVCASASAARYGYGGNRGGGPGLDPAQPLGEWDLNLSFRYFIRFRSAGVSSENLAANGLRISLAGCDESFENIPYTIPSINLSRDLRSFLALNSWREVIDDLTPHGSILRNTCDSRRPCYRARWESPIPGYVYYMLLFN